MLTELIINRPSQKKLPKDIFQEQGNETRKKRKTDCTEQRNLENVRKIFSSV